MDTASIIKSQLTCTEFLQGMGVEINRAGFCKCPFHGDHDASMKVYRDPERGYHCFGCHAGGDLINLAMRWYGSSFRDAIRQVADDFSIDLPDERKQNEAQRKYSAIMTELRGIRRELDRMERRHAEDAFWQAFDSWLDNDRTIAENAPRSVYETFSDAWCEAVKNREAIIDDLKITQERRNAYYARK